jgi:hypothetical protein
MWEIEPYLPEGEEIQYKGSPAWIGYFWGFVFSLITIWTIFIPLLIVLFIVLDKLPRKYVITNNVVAARYGSAIFFSGKFEFSKFDNINSVRIEQGLIGKIFNFGNIVIERKQLPEMIGDWYWESTTEPTYEFIWKYVENPIEVKSKIEKHID